MDPESTEWPDLEKEDPKKFAELLYAFRGVASLTAGFQREIALMLLNDKKHQERFAKESLISEEKALSMLDGAVRQFVEAMPLAEANDVNLFTTAISHHSGLTGDPLVGKLINRLNDEALELDS